MNLDGFDPERFEAQIEGLPGSGRSSRAALGMPERWILSRLQAVAGDVDTALDGFRFADAANAIYHFVWHELCDWYIELAKPALHQGPEIDQDPAKAARRHLVQGVLARALETTMRLLHPFAPYVTEEIWQKLPKPTQLPESLMITVFPRGDQSWVDPAAEAEMQQIQDIVVACRMLRQTYNVPPAQAIAVELRVANPDVRSVIDKHKSMIERMAKITATLEGGGGAVAGAAKTVVGPDVEIVMPLGGLIDVAAEKTRIAKDIAKADKEIAGLEKKLANADFIARAPEEVVAEQKTRLADEKTRRQRLVDALATLGGAS
jgi:valyl-tRNA synthetase